MFGGFAARLAMTLCALAVMAGVSVGCGGDEGDSTTEQAETRFSAAAEPSKVFMRRMANLLATTTAKKDCPQLEEINQRSYARFTCPPDKGLRESMDQFKVVGTAEYGTGAVVDYRSGKIKDGATVLLYVAPDRNWGISRFGVITEPSTKTSDDDSRDGYQQAVDDYLTAVRERDCEAFREVAYISPDVKDGEVCGTVFGATKELAERMKLQPDVEPVYQGGTDTYGFFSFETIETDDNSTISVVKSGSGDDPKYVVLDVAPSPTSAEQKRVEREYRRQMRSKPETGSGKKPLPQKGADH
jgi:hypothetical protein